MSFIFFSLLTILFKITIDKEYKKMFFLLSVLDLDQLIDRVNKLKNSHVIRKPEFNKSLFWYFKGITLLYFQDYQNALEITYLLSSITIKTK